MLRSKDIHCLLMLITFLLSANQLPAEEILRYAGATTLQRYFMPEAARIFYEQTGVRIKIEGGNTNPGINALQQGRIDLAGAGRHLTEAEKAEGLVEHFLGWDVLTIVVNRENPVKNLSRSQLQGIYSGQITNWKEVGGPDQPIIIVTSPKGSGMRAAVQELILDGQEYRNIEVIAAIVAEADQQVSLLPTAITALSLSMVDNPNVKTIEVDGIQPTSENIVKTKYSLAKPLVLVTQAAPAGNLKRFIDFSLSSRGQNILKKHFVPRHPSQD
ncbi:MAG: phosphate ABC transporter substrate-binding protein [Deltaproteobacteria bacterium]|jgi:phosphate transport system substrate-binding protein|nr:phosphate ABC transporter substrate-binding protein [Deltaproteobacteria bacterium]MBW2518784.1 phosphate ABC transporter substrate-binding protein [Deltaproteobacteria bacterium]